MHQSLHLAFVSGNDGVMGNQLHENSTGCFESEWVLDIDKDHAISKLITSKNSTLDSSAIPLEGSLPK